MENEKDRFGDKMKLVERAKEDIYFAAKDRELIEKLKEVLKKVEGKDRGLVCPKCLGSLEGYSFMGFFLDRCRACGGVWLDKGELEGILREAARSRFGPLIQRFIASYESALGEERRG